ncbi:hypothetical protein HK096_004676, partial [Nowakowskiella sp. JEL0078]
MNTLGGPSNAQPTSIASSPPRTRKQSLAERTQHAFATTGLPVKRTTSIPLAALPAYPPITPGSSPSLAEDVYPMDPADYELGLPIGFGSSAAVYIARCIPLNKNVAIKMIDLDMFERNQIDEMRREIQIMSLSRHPNLLPVQGSFVNGAKLYIITPFLAAGSCLDIMKTAYPDGLEEAAIATILKQGLQGLEYLHRNGLIHRDVKAGNLLIDDDGLVQLADFGVSSSLMETGERKGLRKTFVGTPCWMAPEVMEQSGYDYKADIWSFGITALELATGHAPFAQYPPIKTLPEDQQPKNCCRILFSEIPKKDRLPPINLRQHLRTSVLQSEIKTSKPTSWDFSSKDDDGKSTSSQEGKRRVIFNVQPYSTEDIETGPVDNISSQISEIDSQSEILQESINIKKSRFTVESASENLQPIDKTKHSSQNQFPPSTIENQTHLQTSQTLVQRSHSPQNQNTKIGQPVQNPQSGQLSQVMSSSSIVSLSGMPSASTKKGRFSITESPSGGSVEGASVPKVLVSGESESSIPNGERISEPSIHAKSRFTVSPSTESLNINHPPPNLPQSQSALPLHHGSQQQSVNVLSESTHLPRSRFEVTDPNKSYPTSTSSESTNTSPSNSFSRTSTNNRPSLNMSHPHGSTEHVQDR